MKRANNYRDDLPEFLQPLYSYSFKLTPETRDLLDYIYDNWKPVGKRTWDKLLNIIAVGLLGEQADEVRRKLRADRYKVYNELIKNNGISQEEEGKKEV